jgi:hypothetical protein
VVALSENYYIEHLFRYFLLGVLWTFCESLKFWRMRLSMMFLALLAEAPGSRIEAGLGALALPGFAILLRKTGGAFLF